MNKRGQFFLIATLAIIGVAIGLASIYTSTEILPEDETVIDLSKEVGIEAASIIDYGTFNSLSYSENINNVNLLTDAYAKAHPNIDLIVIQGNSSNLTITSYVNKDLGSLGLTLGSSNSHFSVVGGGEITNSIDPQGKTTVTILVDPDDKNIRHTFELTPGETFFIIAKEEKQGERYVAASI